MQVWRIRYGHEQTEHEILMLVTHWTDNRPHGYQVWNNAALESWHHYAVDNEPTTIGEYWIILSREPLGVVNRISLTT